MKTKATNPNRRKAISVNIYAFENPAIRRGFFYYPNCTSHVSLGSGSLQQEASRVSDGVGAVVIFEIVIGADLTNK